MSTDVLSLVLLCGSSMPDRHYLVTLWQYSELLFLYISRNHYHNYMAYVFYVPGFLYIYCLYRSLGSTLFPFWSLKNVPVGFVTYIFGLLYVWLHFFPDRLPIKAGQIGHIQRSPPSSFCNKRLTSDGVKSTSLMSEPRWLLRAILIGLPSTFSRYSPAKRRTPPKGE